MRAMIGALCGCLAVCGAVAAAGAAEALPTVRQDRPRLILRAKTWDGPSIEQIKGWMDRPECQAHHADLQGVAGDTLCYLIKGG